MMSFHVSDKKYLEPYITGDLVIRNIMAGPEIF
jgi:hypothetical protein